MKPWLHFIDLFVDAFKKFVEWENSIINLLPFSVTAIMKLNCVFIIKVTLESSCSDYVLAVANESICFELSVL